MSGPATMMRCVRCNGKGCDLCRTDDGYYGAVEIGGCPTRLVTTDAVNVVKAADFAKRGILPVAGGWLDQAAGWADAVRFVWSDQDYCEAEAMKRR